MQIWNGLFGYAAEDGGSWMQVGGGSTLDTVSQTVTTTAGDSMVLQLLVLGATRLRGRGQRLQRGLERHRDRYPGAERRPLNAPSWHLATYIVKATGKDTLSFAQGPGASAGLGALIDAVSLADSGPSGFAFASPLVNLAYGRSASAAEIGVRHQRVGRGGRQHRRQLAGRLGQSSPAAPARRTTGRWI